MEREREENHPEKCLIVSSFLILSNFSLISNHHLALCGCVHVCVCAKIFTRHTGKRKERGADE